MDAEKTEAPCASVGWGLRRGLQRRAPREKAAGPPHQTLEPERAGRGGLGQPGLGKESGLRVPRYQGSPGGEKRLGGGWLARGGPWVCPVAPRRHRRGIPAAAEPAAVGRLGLPFPLLACRPGCCV